jgi:hypothetical protein
MILGGSSHQIIGSNSFQLERVAPRISVGFPVHFMPMLQMLGGGGGPLLYNEHGENDFSFGRFQFFFHFRRKSFCESFSVSVLWVLRQNKDARSALLLLFSRSSPTQLEQNLLCIFCITDHDLDKCTPDNALQ